MDIRIATRKSALALWQAEHVAALLEALPEVNSVGLVPLSTRGDEILDKSLQKIGGKGLFIKELEIAMQRGVADIAVHSMKDVPVALPDGLHLAVIMQREDPRDAFVSNHHAGFSVLPEGALVGTSSLRRQCQLADRRPDLEIIPLRGNVNTRLRKLDEGGYDAIILAAAGLLRLGFGERIRSFIDIDDSLPAIGQGAIGIECRADDARVNALLQPLHHAPTASRVRAERAMNHRLEGGCQVPIAAHGTIKNNSLALTGLVADVDGALVIKGEKSGPIQFAETIGIDLAEELLDRGAIQILEKLKTMSIENDES